MQAYAGTPFISSAPFLDIQARALVTDEVRDNPPGQKLQLRDVKLSRSYNKGGDIFRDQIKRVLNYVIQLIQSQRDYHSRYAIKWEQPGKPLNHFSSALLGNNGWLSLNTGIGA